MKINVLSGIALSALFLLPPPAPGGDSPAGGLQALIERSLSDDPETSGRAIAGLRAMGLAGVDALHEAYQKLAPNPSPWPSKGGPDEKLLRLRRALDAVARQKDAHASRLFWHTDMDRALAEARRTGRPLLSLRLLGNLDEDLSCANSRFFRTVLYANAAVSSRLRDHFVLHWQSVRPVPRITIDLGDGRRIERTITGNSIHYVLDSRGELIDAIPGLYGPAAFLRAIERAQAAAGRASAVPAGPERDDLLRAYHLAAREETLQTWLADLTSLGLDPPSLSVLSIRALESRTTEEAWARIGALHGEDARLDEASVLLIGAKAPPELAEAAAKLAMTKLVVENPFFKMLGKLHQAVAVDTVRNEYLLHSRIHEWLADPAPLAGVRAFNERVYSELFLSPLSDPWMGLAPTDSYAALDRGGLLAGSAH